MDLTELFPVSHNAGSGKVPGGGMENRRRFASLPSLAESQQVLDVIIFKKFWKFLYIRTFSVMYIVEDLEGLQYEKCISYFPECALWKEPWKFTGHRYHLISSSPNRPKGTRDGVARPRSSRTAALPRIPSTSISISILTQCYAIRIHDNETQNHIRPRTF